MKYFIRRTLAVTLVLCFILAFSFSAGAVDAVGDAVASLDKGESGNLIEYDYITKTKRIIPLDSIPDYASMTQTTYELEGMRSELTRLAEMSTGISIDTGSSVSPLYLDPTKPYVKTPPKVNGVPVDPYSGVVFLQMKHRRVDEDGFERIGYSRATGFLVAPDVVVTAGHCMDSVDCEIPEIRIYPYINSYIRPSWNYVTDYVHPASWICYEYSSAIRDESIDQTEHDWCVIKLQQPITDAYNFACSYNIDEVLGQEISMSGYPNCIDVTCTKHTVGEPVLCGKDICQQVTSTGNILYKNNNIVRYTNNGAHSSSGSPVYSSQTRICYAIMTYGSVNYNIGNRITIPVYNAISYYINQ